MTELCEAQNAAVQQLDLRGLESNSDEYQGHARPRLHRGARSSCGVSCDSHGGHLPTAAAEKQLSAICGPFTDGSNSSGC